jgi:hypothetical protein
MDSTSVYRTFNIQTAPVTRQDFRKSRKIPKIPISDIFGFSPISENPEIPGNPDFCPSSGNRGLSGEVLGGKTPSQYWKTGSGAPWKPDLCRKRRNRVKKGNSHMYMEKTGPQSSEASRVPRGLSGAFPGRFWGEKRFTYQCNLGPVAPRKPALFRNRRNFVQRGNLHSYVKEFRSKTADSSKTVKNPDFGGSVFRRKNRKICAGLGVRKGSIFNFSKFRFWTLIWCESFDFPKK